MEYKLLLLEDDPALRQGLAFSLERNHYRLKTAATICEAKALLGSEQFDLLLLDVTLPDGSGFEICTWVREQGSRVPVIFLTAKDDEISMVQGLDMGADDYITKPFKLSVLFSRINAVLRRTTEQTGAGLASAGVELDEARARVLVDGNPVELTAGEYRLLRYLMENPNQVLSSEQLLSRLWDCEERYVDGNTLSVYIRRLRRKVERDPSAPCRIVTVRGMGYRWNTGGQA